MCTYLVALWQMFAGACARNVTMKQSCAFFIFKAGEDARSNLIAYFLSILHVIYTVYSFIFNAYYRYVSDRQVKRFLISQ